ncbi:DUF350 domain-containing protein [Microbacteriaceae bacterium 4G12]
MTWMNVVAMAVWTAAGAILLFLLMWIDSIFTKYKDLTEMKNGNTAVTIRFVMKLFAQGYILSQSITKSNDLWQALLASIVSFVILFVIQMIVAWLLKKAAGLDLDRGTLEGKTGYALLGGSLHIVGALILAACL